MTGTFSTRSTNDLLSGKMLELAMALRTGSEQKIGCVHCGYTPSTNRSRRRRVANLVIDVIDNNMHLVSKQTQHPLQNQPTTCRIISKKSKKVLSFSNDSETSGVVVLKEDRRDPTEYFRIIP